MEITTDYLYVYIIGFVGLFAILITVTCVICFCLKRKSRKKPKKMVISTKLTVPDAPKVVETRVPSTTQVTKPIESVKTAVISAPPKTEISKSLGAKSKAPPVPVNSKPVKTSTPLKKPEKPSSELQPCSTQPSLSVDITQPKTESEMTPDELEFLAFSSLDSGKRFQLFNSAVKMAEKIAESHGFWVNDRDPTVPGDEEAWLQKDADNIVRACVDIHGVPVPDFGANKAEYLEFIEKHSLREIYQIALYTEVDDITRLFFLNSVIERFREVVRKIPKEQLEKCQHPIPLLYRIYKDNPDIFEFKHKKQEKPKRRR